MLPKKIRAFFWTTVVLILIPWLTRPTLAQEASVLYGVFPQRGSPGEEVSLLLDGEGFLEFGRLTNVILEGQELQFFDYAIISNQFSRVRILIPAQASIRETEISFLFENYGADAYFIVMDREQAVEAPLIGSYFPREGQRDTGLTLIFEGRGFTALGEFGALLIGDVELPIDRIQVESDGSLQIDTYLLDELLIGETQIGLYFENASVTGPFFVLARPPDIDQPRMPALGGVFPQEGHVETELVITLEGENLFNLGGLIGVNIGGLDIPVVNQRTVSANSMELTIYLPVETPVGDQFIAVFFENLGFEDYFLVLGREPEPREPVFPSLHNVSPQEGEVDTEIELRLEGENLFELGELTRVHINNFEIPFSFPDILSAESLLVGIYLPEDTPDGQQTLFFEFENASFESSFFILQPETQPPPPPVIPPEVIVVVVVVVVGILGVAGWRALRKPKEPTQKPKEKPDKPPTRIHFNVTMDPGIQSIELSEPSLTADVDLSFIVDVDKGDQQVELDEGSILSQDD